MMEIDLRSDTVTRPTKEMREAMFHAEVGDAAYGEDPTVNALQEKAARMFGKEAALFSPSGTMSNEIAVKVLTNPQEEIICSKEAHVYRYEGGGVPFHSGVSMRLLDRAGGKITASDVENNINPPVPLFPQTSMVVIDDTTTKECCYDFAEVKKIADVCKKHKLSLHVDGARIFNSLAVTGVKPSEYGSVCDTLSFCISKGLGAPVGSLLVGSKSLIEKATRVQVAMGGRMRQAGFLAAAGIYALDNHIVRIIEDHARAKKLASFLQTLPCVDEVSTVETNMIFFKPSVQVSWESFEKRLLAENIKIGFYSFSC